MRQTNEHIEDSLPDAKMQYNTAIKRAKVLINAARWDNAKQELFKALSADPGSATAHYYMSVCYYNLNELDKAKNEAKLAISLSPDYANAYLSLANIALKKEKYSEGLKAIKTALELDPARVDLHVTRSALLINSGDLKKGLNAAEEALRLDPNNKTAGSNRTIALTKLGRHNEADIQANAVISGSPDSAMAWYQKGIQLFGSGKLDEAREAVLESLRLKPENKNAEELLFRIMSAQKGFFSLFWKWNLLLWKFPPSIRWIISISLYLFIRGLTNAVKQYPALTPIAAIIICIWFIFCIYTWIARSTFRLAVRKGWIK